LLKCGSVHEADSGYSCGNLRHAVAEVPSFDFS
jgi:hypothetical protein